MWGGRRCAPSPLTLLVITRKVNAWQEIATRRRRESRDERCGYFESGVVKMRLSLNERAELVARDGTVVGRLSSITIDVDGALVGGKGGSSCFSSSSTSSSQEGGVGETTGQQEPLIPTPRQEVWKHYQQVVPNAGRRALDQRRQRCIDRALKVRSVEECCEAITRLAASRWHNGENPNGVKYLDIEYALGQRSESPDARIDKWLDRDDATPVDPLMSHLSSDAQRMVRAWMADVEAFARNPENPGVRLTGESAIRQLAERVKIVAHIDGAAVRWERADA